MVVHSLAEYEERAVALGTDHAARAALRQQLAAARTRCPLFDTPRWVRDFERVLLRMWSLHAEGRGPCTFEIQDEDEAEEDAAGQ